MNEVLPQSVAGEDWGARYEQLRKDIVGSIQLNQEPIRIVKLERLLPSPGPSKLRFFNFARASSALKPAIPKS